MSQRNDENSISAINVVLAVFFWILALVWLFFIFSMSFEPATESSIRSQGVTEYVNTAFSLSFSDAVIRKCAHIFEFALLTFLIYLADFFTNRISRESAYKDSSSKIINSQNEFLILATFWFSTLFALCDEYFQLFIDGRSGSIFDVLYDLLGIITVLLVIRILVSIRNIIKNKGN